MSAATPVLWHIELSHFNEKARWALDYKGIPHRRRAPLPGLHGAWAAVLTRGKGRRFPILQVDGRTIADSTAIVAVLEELHPDPPLYPDDPGDRERALGLEDYFDENLAPAVRGYAFAYTLDDADATVDSIMPRAGATRKRLMRAVVPAMRPVVRRDYHATEADAAGYLAAIRAAMDRVEAELQPSGYLVGDSFTVADLTAAALFTPTLLPPERQYPPDAVVPVVRDLREELEARPGGKWVFEIFAKHRGVSAEVRG